MADMTHNNDKLPERKAAYQRRQEPLEARCKRCREISSPSIDRCNYHCDNGRRLRMLEVEFSDVTGWSHDNWKNAE